MTFVETRTHFPEMLCVCGHRAGIHLYCGKNACVRNGCSCVAFKDSGKTLPWPADCSTAEASQPPESAECHPAELALVALAQTASLSQDKDAA